jgi:hypothetical protein
MPKIKTDEQMRSEFMPKIRAFADERLTAENAGRIYNFLEPYHFDTDGWIVYQAAKGILQTDVYSEFPAEDNLGYFEALDGFGLIEWLEIAKFADKEYEQLPGGYEKLKNHTLDESSPEYQEYRGKLFVAAIRGIITELSDKQPYLLEGFWNRLSYIDNILEKGWPTRDDLNVKLEGEAKKVFGSASEDDLTSFHSEVEIKHRLCNELRSVFMSDEMVQALWIKGNALEDVYRFCLEEDKSDQIYLAVWEYLEKAERGYIAERVYDRVRLEYEDYLDEVKTWPPEKIIDEAYKLTILYDIQISLDPVTSDFSAERLKALQALDSPLWSLYDEWMRRDFTHMDDITDVITDVADEQAAKIEERSFEDELEDEEGLEP